MGLWFQPATVLAELVRSRKISAEELVEAHLARIDALDARLGSFLVVDRAGALWRAGQIDDAIERGDDPGPLAGVPIAIKDIIATQSLATSAGSRILAGWLPPYDATCVARLRAAGAVILGKLNLDEFAMGSSTENSAFKPCRNPWNVDRVPGGSSGGSAAAVAAGLCAASLGTDTGGSIRQPAAMCGVVGLKPTYGRVSRYGVIAFASSLDQVGPLGRTVGDVALMLEVIGGADRRDSTSIDAPVPRYRDAVDGGVRGLCLGMPDEYFAHDVDPDVAAAVAEAIRVLEHEGATVRKVSLPHTRWALPAYYLIAPAEASSNLARYDGVRYGLRAGDARTSLLDMYCQTRAGGFGPEVKRRIMLGTFALRSGYYDAYYRKAQQVRALIARDFEQVFASGVDAIVSPTTPTPAFRLGEKTGDPMSMYLADVFTLSCNLAGLPGISVPCGLSRDRLPIGLQILGRPLGEETLLRVGGAYERATEWTFAHPELAA